MEKIKAIQTEYNGIVFRSRLEARWASLFDFAHIEYEYEPEGFAFGGESYLPDFYLPDDDVYVEVKPRREGFWDDMLRIKKFVECSKNRVLILGSIPKVDGFKFACFPLVFCDGRDDSCGLCYVPIVPNEGDNNLIFGMIGLSWNVVQQCNRNLFIASVMDHQRKSISWIPMKDFPEYKITEDDYDFHPSHEMYDIARNAKFEFGEKPNNKMINRKGESR